MTDERAYKDYLADILNVVWETAVTDLPALRPQIHHILDNLDKP